MLDISRIFISSLLDNSLRILFSLIEKKSRLFSNKALVRFQKPLTALQLYIVVAFNKTERQQSLGIVNCKGFAVNLSLLKKAER